MKNAKRFISMLFLLGCAHVASAHEGGGIAGGFYAGFMHPFLGWDHVLAMVAVGLWGAFLGNPAIWLLPVVFPLVMAMGGALGVAGFPLPAIETGIALSALMLGILVVFAARPPSVLAALLVGAFAIFHGYAHGTELPHAAIPLLYSAGFVIATGLLHIIGILLGLLAHWPWGRIVVRVAGGVIAVAGLVFLAGLM